MGETAAAEYLQGKGYSVIARNFRGRRGEIDLVVRDGESVVFVEVKTWDRNNTADLEYSINSLKKRRIIRTSRLFLSTHPDLLTSRIRFDVVLVTHRSEEITHIENAFGG